MNNHPSKFPLINANAQDTEPTEVEPPKKLTRPTKKELRIDAPQELGLGFVQISVTAATPMVEEADKSFLDDIKEDDESDDAHSVDRESLEKGVAEAVDQILEEASVETHKKVAAEAARVAKERSKQKPSVTIVDAKRSSSDGPAPAAVGTMKPKKEPVRSGPPSVPPPPPPVVQQQSIDDNKFEANFDDADFEANFDDAYGEEPDLPKQHFGGRASIPDELDPNQVRYC